MLVHVHPILGLFDQGTDGVCYMHVNWLGGRIVMLVSYSRFLLLPEMRIELPGRVLSLLSLIHKMVIMVISLVERNGISKGNCGIVEVIWDLVHGRS